MIIMDIDLCTTSFMMLSYIAPKTSKRYTLNKQANYERLCSPQVSLGGLSSKLKKEAS